MELFKLFGTIAINKDEANAALDEIESKAQSFGSKAAKVFDGIRPKLDKAFQTRSIDDFGESLDDASEDAQDLSKKAKDLSSGLDQAEDALRDADKAADEFGTSIEEAGQSTETSGNKSKSAFEKIRTAISNAFKNDKIKAFGESLKDLTQETEDQQSKLDSLKQKYKDLYLTHGKNSDEARKCAKEIEELSSKLAENKRKLNEADKAADEFDNALDDVADSADKAEGRLSGALGKIGGAVAAAFAVDKIIDFGKEIVGVSGEVSAEVSAFEQIMGDYSDEASAKVEKIADATGMVDTRLTPYMTSMTAKFKGLGYDITDATDYASRGLNLAADAAAFWDKSLDDSMGHLNSFINGSYEGGEAIGLFANDTQMAAYAVKQGIVSEAKEWSNLDEKRKQATRLEYAENMFKMSGATGQAAKEADQYANVQANLTEKWRQFKAQIGEPLLQNVVLPAMEKLSGIVDTASQKFEDLKKWVSENKTELQVATAIAIALGTAISILAVAMHAAAIKTKILTAYTKLATLAQKIYNFVLNANPIGIVITLIAALVAAFIYLWNNCEGFREFWINLWEKIKDVAGKVAEWFKETWNKVVDWFKETWDSVSSFFSDLWEGIKNAVKSVSDWFKDTWQSISDWFTNLWEGIKNAVKTAWDFITNIVNFALQFIGSLISAAWNIITLPWRFIWENIKEYVFAAWEWIKEKVTNAINAVKEVIEKVWTAVSNFFSTIWNKIKEIVGAVWDWISDKVTTAVNAVKNVITNIFNAVKTFVTNVWNAIKNVISTVWNAIKNVVTTAINAVKNVITNIFNAVKTFVSNVWNGIKTVISNVWNGIKSTVSNAVNNVKNKVTSVFNSVKSTVSNIWNGIKEAIRKPIEKARDIVKSAIDRIKSIMNFKWSLPKLKLPHFSISGKFSLNPPSVPKLSVEWYKRAYDQAAMFTNPTVLPTLGGYKGFGDGNGAEFVTGQQNLSNTVRTAVKEESSGTIEKLETLISMLAEFMPELIANSNKKIVLNNGVLVGELAGGLDSRLGEINRLRERGR